MPASIPDTLFAGTRAVAAVAEAPEAGTSRIAEIAAAPSVNRTPPITRLPLNAADASREAQTVTPPNPGGCRLVDPRSEPRWDDWIGAHTEATVFHTAAWAAILQETYGFRPVYLVAGGAERGNDLLPLMECASPFTGRRGVSLPFTDYVPPLARQESAFRTLFDQAIALGRERRWRTLEFRGGTDGLAPAPASLTFYRHTLDLRAGEDRLFAGLDSAVRRAIRKAGRSALEVRREHSWEAVAAYYNLHTQTRRKHGLPPQPLAFFRHLHHHLISHGAGRVFLAYHQGRLIAGLLFLHRGGQVVYKYGASKEEHQELRANNLLFWTAIQFFARAGFQSLDFGRTSTGQEGLRRFKLGWGAAETSVSYVKYHLRQHRFVIDRDRASGWHNAVFRRLPLPVLRWLGARLYPHLT